MTHCRHRSALPGRGGRVFSRRLEGGRETPRVGVAYTAAAAFLPARRPKVSALPRLMPATTTG